MSSASSGANEVTKWQEIYKVRIYTLSAVKAAFLLTNLNPDFAICNLIFHSIKDQISLRLQSEQSTS